MMDREALEYWIPLSAGMTIKHAVTRCIQDAVHPG